MDLIKLLMENCELLETDEYNRYEENSLTVKTLTKKTESQTNFQMLFTLKSTMLSRLDSIPLWIYSREVK